MVHLMLLLCLRAPVIANAHLIKSDCYFDRLHLHVQ